MSPTPPEAQQTVKKVYPRFLRSRKFSASALSSGEPGMSRLLLRSPEEVLRSSTVFSQGSGESVEAGSLHEGAHLTKRRGCDLACTHAHGGSRVKTEARMWG